MNPAKHSSPTDLLPPNQRGNKTKSARVGDKEGRTVCEKTLLGEFRFPGNADISTVAFTSAALGVTLRWPHTILKEQD